MEVLQTQLDRRAFEWPGYYCFERANLLNADYFDSHITNDDNRYPSSYAYRSFNRTNNVSRVQTQTFFSNPFLVALMALKRKKMYEKEVDKIMGSRMTLDAQMSALESTNSNLTIMNAMKLGADAMKQQHGQMYDLLFLQYSIDARITSFGN